MFVGSVLVRVSFCGIRQSVCGVCVRFVRGCGVVVSVCKCLWDVFK